MIWTDREKGCGRVYEAPPMHKTKFSASENTDYCSNGTKHAQVVVERPFQITTRKRCMVEPLIKEPLIKGQPLNKGPSSYSSVRLISEKRTTSQQRTRWLSQSEVLL